METLSKQIASMVKFYTNDPSKRCMDKEGRCKYSGKTLGLDTPGCMVGYLMPEELREEIDRLRGTGILQVVDYVYVKLPDIIVNNKFLMADLQFLHDRSAFWTETGLSFDGEVWLRYIIVDRDWET